jgi:hypothetical protein
MCVPLNCSLCLGGHAFSKVTNLEERLLRIKIKLSNPKRRGKKKKKKRKKRKKAISSYYYVLALLLLFIEDHNWHFVFVVVCLGTQKNKSFGVL